MDLIAEVHRSTQVQSNSTRRSRTCKMSVNKGYNLRCLRRVDFSKTTYSTLVLLITLQAFTVNVNAFNVDTKFPIVYTGDPGSYFGYTVALHRNREGPIALVAATRANSTYYDTVFQPGVIYKCPVKSTVPKCQEVILDRRPVTEKWTSDYSYRDSKDNMWLGVSLQVQPNQDGNVVACGHLWKNVIYEDFYSANGVCYIINKELEPSSSIKLLPLINKKKQTNKENEVYVYAYGQAGTSAAFTGDGSELILGAPGVYNWVGNIIKYSTKGKPKEISHPMIPEPHYEHYSYLGYSVTTGHFAQYADNYYAVGAPRGGSSNKGKVFIVEPIPDSFYASKIGILQHKEGKQVGEYFGASVLGVDLNKDDFTDLLVGAPLYSLPGGGDEGRVALYMGSIQGIQPKNLMLMGLKKPGARFGSSIAKIGDINQDQYQDVAIGAPYEDEHGAVYIYHGSSSGIRTEFAQRIGAEDVKANVPLNGFGISIATAEDVDSNHYNDLLIGSYASDTAVLLRSHPIIEVKPEITFNVSKINVDYKDCIYAGKEMSCLSITYCLHYNGKYAPPELTFDVVLKIDAKRQDDGLQTRGYFLYENQMSQSISHEIHVIASRGQTCRSKIAHIYDKVENFQIPVPFSLTYSLRNDTQTSKEFCASCPVINAIEKGTTFEKTIGFQTGCGDDEVCHCILVVTAGIEDFKEGASLIVGQDSSFTVLTTVENKDGEPAYQPRLIVKLPEHANIINPSGCDILASPDDEERNQTLSCKVFNPLRKGSKEEFRIKLSLPWLESTTKEIKIKVHAETDSYLTDPAPSKTVLTLPVEFRADVTIEGGTEKKYIEFNGEHVPEAVELVHIYEVRKFLQSPVQSVEVKFFFPTTVKGIREEILSLPLIEVIDSREMPIPGSCNSTLVEADSYDPQLLIASEMFLGNKTKPKSRTKRDAMPAVVANILSHERKSQNEILDCFKYGCKAITCTAGPFLDSKSSAKFRITAVLHLRRLIEAIGDKDALSITSWAQIRIADEGFTAQPDGHKPDFAMVVTELSKERMGQEKLPDWVIPVSIGIGIIILGLILLALVHFGFFRRKQKEEMERLMKSDDGEEKVPLNESNEHVDSTPSSEPEKSNGDVNKEEKLTV